MSVKYQVFVSSTYEDLKNEREQVVRALLEMGHIPVGMEMFSAADETQWQVIARTIENCDYYIVIIAHRYGSMDSDISYTEKEYDYATKIGIPTLAFVIDDSAPWPKKQMEEDEAKRKALNVFTAKVKQKMATIWKSSDDLYARAPIALMKQMTITPRPGWIRATEAVSSDVMNELSRLSRENSELRNQLQLARSTVDNSEDRRTRAWMDFFDRCHDSLVTEIQDGSSSGRLLPRNHPIHRRKFAACDAEIQKALGRLAMSLDHHEKRLLKSANDLFASLQKGTAGTASVEALRQKIIQYRESSRKAQRLRSVPT